MQQEKILFLHFERIIRSCPNMVYEDFGATAIEWSDNKKFISITLIVNSISK